MGNRLGEGNNQEIDLGGSRPIALVLTFILLCPASCFLGLFIILFSLARGPALMIAFRKNDLDNLSKCRLLHLDPKINFPYLLKLSLQACTTF
jgi:hypothetical protein